MLGLRSKINQRTPAVAFKNINQKGYKNSPKDEA